MPNAPQRLTPEAQEAARIKGLDPSRGTHGTAYTPGQTSVEGHKTAGISRPTFDEYSKDRAYYTADYKHSEAKGWEWAGSAARARGEPTDPDSKIQGRPVVHDVEPQGDIDIDRNMGDYRFGEMTADKLNITDTHWIRPPYADETGVQGTLPNVNWNQFAHPDLARGMDLNNGGISRSTGHMKGSVEHDQAVRDRKLTVENFGMARPTPLRGVPAPPGDRKPPEPLVQPAESRLFYGNG